MLPRLRLNSPYAPATGTCQTKLITAHTQKVAAVRFSPCSDHFGDLATARTVDERHDDSTSPNTCFLDAPVNNHFPDAHACFPSVYQKEDQGACLMRLVRAFPNSPEELPHRPRRGAESVGAAQEVEGPALDRTGSTVDGKARMPWPAVRCRAEREADAGQPRFRHSLVPNPFLGPP